VREFHNRWTQDIALEEWNTCRSGVIAGEVVICKHLTEEQVRTAHLTAVQKPSAVVSAVTTKGNGGDFANILRGNGEE
jgi:hypothetical protein